MDIHLATQRYEAWLGKHIVVLKPDLAAKHQAMSENPFSFLRATFYRWAQIFPMLCPAASAPTVLSVGDLHLANYGTWRDAEGRLVWGINDFDEAFPLPYTNDLVRLATSAQIANKTGELGLPPAKASAAILEGYTYGMAHGGDPFVLSERHPWLRATVTTQLRDPVRYWEKLSSQRPVARIPKPVRAILTEALPEFSKELRVTHRMAGLGSLGRERYTAVAELRGGKIAREAKALLPSAWAWAMGKEDISTIYYAAILQQGVRSADPFLTLKPGWVLRRLSPYCSRIDLNQLPAQRDEKKLLRAMGRELANIHIGDKKAASLIKKDLAKRDPQWLRHASDTMLKATFKDWAEWRGTKRKTKAVRLSGQ